MSSQGQQSGKGGYGQQSFGQGSMQGYGQSPYQMNPAQQGSFFSNGGGSRPPMQTLPYQIPGSGWGSILPPGSGSPYQIPDSGWGPILPPGSGGSVQAARMMDTGSQFGTSIGGFNGVAANPINLGAQVGGGAPATPAAPGVQTFQNGAYANWGQPQPAIQNPTAPSVLPPQQTFQNGAYGNWGGAPNPFANPLARPFTNGY